MRYTGNLIDGGGGDVVPANPPAKKPTTNPPAKDPAVTGNTKVVDEQTRIAAQRVAGDPRFTKDPNVAGTSGKATKTPAELLVELQAQEKKLGERLTALQALKDEATAASNIAKGLNADGTKLTRTQQLQKDRATAAGLSVEEAAGSPLFNKANKPEAPAGYRYVWLGGTATGQWTLRQNLGVTDVGTGGTGGAQTQTKATDAVKPTIVTQKTVRKSGGTVQTVNVMSDESEVVVDEYKDYSARDAVMQMFENTNLGDTFLKSLMDSIDTVYTDNIAPTESQVLNSIYNSEAYKTRFSANETIRKRMADGKGRPGDRLLKPADYIETEKTFRDIMSEAGLPAGFYDTQEDFSNFIANGVSPGELQSRVNIAQAALQKADKNVVDALKSYYNLSTTDMVAYLLDKDKAFNLIEGRFSFSTAELEKQYKSAEVGGMATRAGMTADKALSEEIVAADKGGKAEEAFQLAATNQKDYKRLLGLAGQKAGESDLVRQQLGLVGGTDVEIKTKKLASQERARFKQKSAIDTTSLGRRFKTADV
jgi:hypothetical protein